MSLSRQAATVLDHLRHNEGLTSWEAQGVYRIRRLASRVDELRAEGYAIATESKHDATGQRYTRYSLTPDQKKVGAPIGEARRQPRQFRIERIEAAYRDYCIANLDMTPDEAAGEVEDFLSFLKAHAA